MHWPGPWHQHFDDESCIHGVAAVTRVDILCKSLGMRLPSVCLILNLVPRACYPREGIEGSGIIRCRKPGILAKIELRIHFNSQSDSSLKRIIPEPRVPSRGSQAQGTRLPYSVPNTVSAVRPWDRGWCPLCII
jgi:hypothetical protein